MHTHKQCWSYLVLTLGLIGSSAEIYFFVLFTIKLCWPKLEWMVYHNLELWYLFVNYHEWGWKSGILASHQRIQFLYIYHYMPYYE